MIRFSKFFFVIIQIYKLHNLMEGFGDPTKNRFKKLKNVVKKHEKTP